MAILLGFFDLLKGVAWPLVVLAIAFGFKYEIKNARPALLSMLQRGFNFEAFGAKFAVQASQQQSELAIAKVMDLKEIPGLPRTTAIANLERTIHQWLTTIDKNTMIDVLVRNLAGAQLESLFGTIYPAIFGSQIRGLEILYASRTVPASSVHEFYLGVEKEFPTLYNNYGFPGWIGFMQNSGLVAREGDTISITPIGDDFVQWLSKKALPKNKPF